MMLQRILSFLVFSVITTGIAQNDTIPEVSIYFLPKKKIESISNQTIDHTDILKNQPTDLGNAVQKMSGVNLKSYGGLGGMKTISVKGLGSHHTNVAIDEFNVFNSQTGQLNLANIQVDNIEQISISNQYQNNYLIPVSSIVSGSLLSVYTFENTFSDKKNQVRFSSKYGSFGEIDNYLSAKYNFKKIMFSGFGKIRESKGDYPYELINGKQIYSGVRSNNSYKDNYFGGTFGIKISDKSYFRIIYKNNEINQGLPNAIILYNNLNNQTLSTKNQTINTDYKVTFKGIHFRVFGIGQLDDLNYRDPSYLNNSGGINNTYNNRVGQVGLSSFKTLKKTTIYGGLDHKYADLHFSDTNFSIPIRNHFVSLIGLNQEFYNWNINLQGSYQAIQEKNKMGEKAPDRSINNALFSIESPKFFKKTLQVKLFYKNSFRMPSFNELYYNSIGNNQLKPETATQYSFGLGFEKKWKKTSVNLFSNSYHSFIENQILAIPTKNLFVWSMQNIGKVEVFGLESRADLSIDFNERWNLNLNGNYTYQESLDISDQNSPTYRNQIAYTPKHTINSQITLKRQNIGLGLNHFYLSNRYALNENIKSNLIESFNVVDANIHCKFELKNKNNIRLQFTLRNIFNESYVFVKYYVMPGRSFLISLNYAFN